MKMSSEEWRFVAHSSLLILFVTPFEKAVGVARLELTTSSSRTKRATSCATPRNLKGRKGKKKSRLCKCVLLAFCQVYFSRFTKNFDGVGVGFAVVDAQDVRAVHQCNRICRKRAVEPRLDRRNLNRV